MYFYVTSYVACIWNWTGKHTINAVNNIKVTMCVEKTTFKGIFRRFNGFSEGGWYIDTTFQKRTLKSPEKGLKRNCGILLKNPIKNIIVYINKNTIKR